MRMVYYYRLGLVMVLDGWTILLGYFIRRLSECVCDYRVEKKMEEEKSSML